MSRDAVCRARKELPWSHAQSDCSWPTGRRRGLRTAQVGNWSGLALVCPRTDLVRLGKRDPVHGPGVYFLIGPSEQLSSRLMVYVGEADDVWVRLQNHAGKEFWTSVILFVSKDENLTKAHVRWLEAQLFREIRDAKRADVENEVEPGGCRLPARPADHWAGGRRARLDRRGRAEGVNRGRAARHWRHPAPCCGLRRIGLRCGPITRWSPPCSSREIPTGTSAQADLAVGSKCPWPGRHHSPWVSYAEKVAAVGLEPRSELFRDSPPDLLANRLTKPRLAAGLRLLVSLSEPPFPRPAAQFSLLPEVVEHRSQLVPRVRCIGPVDRDR